MGTVNIKPAEEIEAERQEAEKRRKKEKRREEIKEELKTAGPPEHSIPAIIQRLEKVEIASGLREPDISDME